MFHVLVLSRCYLNIRVYIAEIHNLNDIVSNTNDSFVLYQINSQILYLLAAVDKFWVLYCFSN